MIIIYIYIETNILFVLVKKCFDIVWQFLTFLTLFDRCVESYVFFVRRTPPHTCAHLRTPPHTYSLKSTCYDWQIMYRIYLSPGKLKTSPCLFVCVEICAVFGAEEFNRERENHQKPNEAGSREKAASCYLGTIEKLCFFLRRRRRRIHHVERQKTAKWVFRDMVLLVCLPVDEQLKDSRLILTHLVFVPQPRSKGLWKKSMRA